jgi:hypothetical protein
LIRPFANVAAEDCPAVKGAKVTFLALQHPCGNRRESPAGATRSV